MRQHLFAADSQHLSHHSHHSTYWFDLDEIELRNGIMQFFFPKLPVKITTKNHQLEGHPYVSGMAPSRPPAAAPFPASFPTGIWPPGQLQRGMEAAQRTVPGQQPGLVAGQPQLPVFNHMLSNHQVGHGPWNNPYGQVGAQHQTLQREVVMETGHLGDSVQRMFDVWGWVFECFRRAAVAETHTWHTHIYIYIFRDR